MRTTLTQDVSKIMSNTGNNFEFIVGGKKTTQKTFVLKFSNHFHVAYMTVIHQ